MATLFLGVDVRGPPGGADRRGGTRTTHRGRGLARAVVSAAIAEAHRCEAELIIIPADADDWPQVMYARLGFTATGRQVSVTLRGRAASDSVSGGV